MEQVLVIERQAIAADLPHRDLRVVAFDELVRRMQDRVFFIDRDTAEGDPELKQLIPYLALTMNGKVFLVRRKSRQTEQRLHDRWSLGIGGHINPADYHAELAETIERAARRELAEEVALLNVDRLVLPFVGLLNDDSDDVGKVHLGLFYRVALPPDGDVEVREKEKMTGQWVDRRMLPRFHPLEGWSRIVSTAWEKI